MAITFITGIARSGKSYYSVHYLYQMYKNHLHKRNWFMQWVRYYISPLEPKEYYQTTYTNINQFNFDFSERIKPLDFQDLRAKLKKLHDLRVNQNVDDEEMIMESKRLGLHNCLFVIDEGAHYFTKPVDKVLIWWLTYHGHLHQDIHIITQHMDQVPSEYIKNGEFFYMSYPSSSAIFKNKINYGLYKSGKFTQKGKISDFTIPLVAEVFSLYVSGKLPKRKPVLKKFVPIFAFLFVFLFWSIWNFNGNTQKNIEDSKALNKSEEEIIIDINSNSNSEVDIFADVNKSRKEKEEDLALEDLNSLKLVKLQCIKDMCIYKDTKFTIDFLLFVVKKYKPEYSHMNEINNNYIEYTFLFDEKIIYLFETLRPGQKKNQKKTRYSQNPSIKLFGN